MLTSRIELGSAESAARCSCRNQAQPRFAADALDLVQGRAADRTHRRRAAFQHAYAAAPLSHRSCPLGLGTARPRHLRRASRHRLRRCRTCTFLGAISLTSWRVAWRRFTTGASPRWCGRASGTRMNWPVPLLDISGFDQSPTLSADEREALMSLGWHLRRHRSHDAALPEWDKIQRLLAPLDAARLMLRKPLDTQQQRRAAMDAVGFVLLRCVEEVRPIGVGPRRAGGGSSARTGGRSADPGRTGWTHRRAPISIQDGYLLCGFNAFHCLGGFNRLALAYRLFGREAVEIAKERIAAKLEAWGYRSARVPQMGTIIAQVLLVNRSPRVEDLNDDEVFVSSAG